jgi:hypothetical protein
LREKRGGDADGESGVNNCARHDIRCTVTLARPRTYHAVMAAMNDTDRRTLRVIRRVLVVFMLALVLSGVTAFPLIHELNFLVSMLGGDAAEHAATKGMLLSWLVAVRDGLVDTQAKYPWMAYGTDWLAFAHIAIAVFFVGPLVDPVRNIWVLRAGLIACALVIPLALVCGEVRGIPFGWRLIDCSFGIVGAVPLWYCLRLSRKLDSTRDRSSG